MLENLDKETLGKLIESGIILKAYYNDDLKNPSWKPIEANKLSIRSIPSYIYLDEKGNTNFNANAVECAESLIKTATSKDNFAYWLQRLRWANKLDENEIELISTDETVRKKYEKLIKEEQKK